MMIGFPAHIPRKISSAENLKNVRVCVDLTAGSKEDDGLASHEGNP
jgi:hypothetical protein